MSMLGRSALVVGTARNCAEGLRRTLPRLEGFQESFDRLKYIVVTNDSDDDTADILWDWSSQSNNVAVVELNGLVLSAPRRTVRLAIARNVYLAELRRDAKRGVGYEFLIVVDLDGLNAGLIDEPHFTQAIESAPANWGALFANQRDYYYDIWALRHSDWSPDDCWQQVRKYEKKLFWRKRDTAIEKYVHARQIKIGSLSPPIPVDSAFGGFGIYRTSYLRAAYHVGQDDKKQPVCEHVHFNGMVKANGANLFILPSLLNDTPPRPNAQGIVTVSPNRIPLAGNPL
jgi:hypothetical protein